MNKKVIISFIAIFLIIITIVIIKKGKSIMINEIDMPGARHEQYVKGYNEKIKSKNIISFSYNNSDYKVSCNLEKDKIHITSQGGNNIARDGSAFKLDYKTNDNNFLKELNEIIIKYEIANNNGHIIQVNGLPSGLGDTISVEYKSGEKIYKSSNESHTITDEASKAIYKLFNKLAKNNGYDFTTDKSNVNVYNDATIEYLQGTWKGKHFGEEVKVVIKDNNIKIYCDDKLTDDTEFIIINGTVKKNKLKENIIEAQNEYDYEEFNAFSSIKKKNDILLVAYFTKDEYSTAELLIQK